MFDETIFGQGKIVYNDMQIDEEKSLTNQIDNLKEDLFQVNYDDRYIIDVGWFPSFSIDGEFRIVVIADFDWDKPMFKQTCRSVSELRALILESVTIVKEKL